MNEPENPGMIVRVAAKGDGVTADGRFVAQAAPGDILNADGVLEHGPHHAEPACRHFGSCGGCALQQLDPDSYAEFVSERVVNALKGQELEIPIVHPPQISRPKSRIRASMRAARSGGHLQLGFSGAGSHRIIDLQQCEILHPALFALVAPLREYLGQLDRKKHEFQVEMTLVDQGPDLLITNYEPEGLEEREALSLFAQQNGLARLALDYGLGPETQWEPDPVTVSFGDEHVAFPQGAFLQPTRDGEDMLVAAVREIVGDSRLVADLFAGLGTFSLSLTADKKVYAAEASRDAIGALKMTSNSSTRQIFCEHRDLYRRPLSTDELDRFQAVILDPPRAGARQQADQLAGSQVPVICYVSCNPSSFARDAKRLVDGGYRLEQVWPVGQFLWSTHVELVAGFRRG